MRKYLLACLIMTLLEVLASSYSLYLNSFD